jgi:F-type H+-transporting ATPase subunit a
MADISLAAETVFHLGPLPVTNSLLTSWIAMLLLVVGAYVLRRKIKELPGMFQNIIEYIFESALNLMDSVTQDNKQSRKFFPFVFTFFMFIIVGNWLGLLPGVGTIGFREISAGKEIFVPLFRGPAADLNFTLALALLSVVATQIIAITTIGFSKHMKKYINFKDPIMGFVGGLEAISEFAKILSFSFLAFGIICGIYSSIYFFGVNFSILENCHYGSRTLIIRRGKGMNILLQRFIINCSKTEATIKKIIPSTAGE